MNLIIQNDIIELTQKMNDYNQPQAAFLHHGLKKVNINTYSIRHMPTPIYICDRQISADNIAVINNKLKCNTVIYLYNII